MQPEIQVFRTIIDSHLAFEIFAVLEGRVIGHTKVCAEEPVLVDLWVEEEYRREGIGRALVHTALREMKSHFLKVRSPTSMAYRSWPGSGGRWSARAWWRKTPSLDSLCLRRNSLTDAPSLMTTVP